MKVILIMTATVDGFISRDSNDPAEFADAFDMHFFTKETQRIGTVIYGMNSYRILGEPFPGILNMVMSTSPNIGENVPGVLEFFSGTPQELLERLEKRGVREVALIGGAQLNGSFFFENLIDEIYVTVAPLLFGQGVNISTGYDLETKLSLLDVRPLGDNGALLHYEVLK